MLALLAAALLAAPAAKSPALPAPVAVMPFRNLNADGTLDWLKNGIAETMVSDLRKSGAITVVEREQIDHALGEVLLQDAHPTEESTASKVGKLVGAKTVVVGSFQQADQQVRINARFVAVETGVVLDTAKATGPIERIFSLQDEVVDRLLGTPPETRPVRKATAKSVAAYRLYALSLATTSDAEKIGLLRQSLEQDPEFPYALDDLAALEKRLESYRKAREGAMPDATATLWSRIGDKSLSGYERALAVKHLLDADLDDRRARGVIADAKKILAMKIPDPPPGTIPPAADEATFAMFAGQVALKQRDEAVRTGERYLKKFATGFHYKEIEDGIDELVAERKARNANESFFAERFERIETRRAEERAKLTGDALDVRMMELDYERCDCLWRFRTVLWKKLEEECAGFVSKYKGKTGPEAEELLQNARRDEAEALYEQGRFAEALEKIHGLEKDLPESNAVREFHEELKNDWPRDAVPAK